MRQSKAEGEAPEKAGQATAVDASVPLFIVWKLDGCPAGLCAPWEKAVGRYEGTQADWAVFRAGDPG